MILIAKPVAESDPSPPYLQLYSLFLTRAAGEVGSGGLKEWLRAGLAGLEAITV